MQGNRITDPRALTTGIVWALLTYGDGSQLCIQTTLDPQYLNQAGILLEEGKLVRLDKKYLKNGQMVYKQFDYSDATVSLWDAETYTDAVSEQLKQFV